MGSKLRVILSNPQNWGGWQLAYSRCSLSEQMWWVDWWKVKPSPAVVKDSGQMRPEAES